MSVARDSVNLSLRAALDLRWQRQQVLADNLANADTPGFRPKDLEFEGVLQSAISAGSPGKIDLAQPGDGGAAPSVAASAITPERDLEKQELVQRPEVGDTIDDNAVDTDKELARIADNSLTYRAELELLRRRYAAIQRTITSMSGA